VPALAGGVAVVALLAFCTPAMALFFVGRGSTSVPCCTRCWAFAALRRGRFGPGWVLAVVLLVAGCWAISYSSLRGNTFAPRQVSWRGCGSEGGKAPRAMSLLRSQCGDRRPRSSARGRAGRVPVQPALSVVNLHQIFANLGHAPGYFSDLLASRTACAITGSAVRPARVHVVGALCVLACLVVALRSLVTGFGALGPRRARRACLRHGGSTTSSSSRFSAR